MDLRASQKALKAIQWRWSDKCTHGHILKSFLKYLLHMAYGRNFSLFRRTSFPIRLPPKTPHILLNADALKLCL